MMNQAASFNDSEQKQYSFSSNLQTVKKEHGFQACYVEGEIPKDLSGTLYRNGPGVFERFGKKYGHWFGGQGVINAMRFDHGQAECAVRLVQTPEHQKEMKSKKALYADYGSVAPGSWFKRIVRFPKNAANTSVLYWQNKLYALEEGHLATEINPDTLETLGETNFDLSRMERFSAHPSWVTDLQCGFNFGVTLGRKSKLQLFKLPKSQPLEFMAEHELPGFCNIHDFIVTNTHMVFFIAPVRVKLLDLLLGRKSFAHAQEWRPELKTQVWCIPIDKPETKVVIKTDPCFVFHFANAFDSQDQQQVNVDYIYYPDFKLHDSLFDVQKNIGSETLGGALFRATIDLTSATLKHQVLCSKASEFPIVPPAFQGKASPSIFTASIDVSGEASSINRIDFDSYSKPTGEAHYDFDMGCFCSEPVFVPKQNQTMEGYLLSLTYDAQQHKSYIAILDAQELEQGVIAKAYFDQNIPIGFHGRWVPKL